MIKLLVFYNICRPKYLLFHYFNFFLVSFTIIIPFVKLCEKWCKWFSVLFYRCVSRNGVVGSHSCQPSAVQRGYGTWWCKYRFDKRKRTSIYIRAIESASRKYIFDNFKVEVIRKWIDSSSKCDSDSDHIDYDDL